ncbi:Rap1a/Tai family immunity protein [Tardiphaga sp. 538_B7_N1_4]|uniref:Rap1a/Tai family immunity protein n=1 Tax=Tardiphaga sp. 538_B7_N1_4 TaxID=3240778 RepID=UPI003F249D66
MIRIALTASLVALASPAWSQEDTDSGNYLLPHCKHAIDTGRQSYDAWDGKCNGIVSTIMFYGQNLPQRAQVCFPKGSTLGQAMRIVIRYLETHPENLHLDLRNLAATALHEVWPCR